MPTSVRDFWSTLVRLRLIDASAAEQLARHLETAGANDPVDVAKALIANQWLTKFQAKRLLADRGDELVQGEFLVLDKADSMPLGRWFRARHFASAAEYFIYPCSGSPDSRSPVDLAWLQPHLMVAAAGLQTIHVVETSPGNPAIGTPWRGLVISELPLGKSLTDWLGENGPIGFTHAIALGEVVGGALAAMHAAGLFHGGLRPGRVWIAGDSSVFLLRSAGGPPIFPGTAVQPPYDWFDDDGLAAMFAAPEWLSGQSHADSRSDVFSLGGLIYHVATGKSITNGQLPPEIATAVSSGAAGDPVLRVLGAALAASPDQRFQDVPSFLQALYAVKAMAAAAPVAAAPVAATTPIPPTSPAPASAAPSPDSVAPAPASAAPSVARPVEPAATQPANRSVVQTPAAASGPDSASKSVAAKKQAAPTAAASVPPASAAGAAPPATRAKSAATTKSGPSASASRQPTAQQPASPPIETPPGAPPTAGADVAAATAATPQVAATSMPAAASSPPAQTIASASAQGTATASVAGTAPAAAPAKEPGGGKTAASGNEPPPRRLRKRNRRNQRGPIIVGASAVAILLLLLAVVLRSTGGSTTAERSRPTPRPTAIVTPTPTSVTPAQSTPAGSPAVASGGDGFELVRDEKTLWVPPWPADSNAPPLDLIVPGAQAIVSVRPQSLLRDSGQADWLGWFGQDLEPALQRLSSRIGVPAKQVDRLVIGLVAGADGEPIGSLAVWLAEPTDLRTLRQKWGVSASKTPTGETIFAGDEPGDDAYFVAGESVADGTMVTSFVVGSLDTVRLIAEGGGGPIPLSRPLQTAWDQTSEKADLVVMVVPNFLFADGRKLLQGYAPRAIDPLRSRLIPNVVAAVLTIDTRQNWYSEVKLLPGGGTTPAVLAREIQNRVNALPAAAESFLVDSDIAPSWRAMAIRLPQFLRAINDQSRYGVSATLATANFYLPATAAPQVTLASLLAMSTTPQETAAVAMTASTPEPTLLTMEQMLEMNLSISFEQESLEFAIGMIGDEFSTGLPEGAPRPKITIIGGDLEKSGITQNQQVRDFKMRDVPLREALTKLVAGANPDKTVTNLTEDKQSLVWVIDPASTAQSPSLLITTRPQAAVKGYKLPQEFVAQ
jgi:hypothetical protein